MTALFGLLGFITGFKDSIFHDLVKIHRNIQVKQGSRTADCMPLANRDFESHPTIPFG
jgi:hypothetical protein